MEGKTAFLTAIMFTLNLFVHYYNTGLSKTISRIGMLLSPSSTERSWFLDDVFKYLKLSAVQYIAPNHVNWTIYEVELLA